MSTAVINIKTDANIKTQAQKIAAEFGLSLSGILNAYLRDLIRNKQISFNLNQKKQEEPTQYMLDCLQESQEDCKRGDVYSFNNPQKALEFIDQI